MPLQGERFLREKWLVIFHKKPINSCPTPDRNRFPDEMLEKDRFFQNQVTATSSSRNISTEDCQK